MKLFNRWLRSHIIGHSEVAPITEFCALLMKDWRPSLDMWNLYDGTLSACRLRNLDILRIDPPREMPQLCLFLFWNQLKETLMSTDVLALLRCRRKTGWLMDGIGKSLSPCTPIPTPSKISDFQNTTLPNN